MATMSDWVKMFSADTSWDELQDISEDYTQYCVDDVRAQLEADPDVSPPQREAILARLRPVCRARTRETFEAGWRDLQLQRVSSNDTVN
jgi:hypothetical protein